MRRSRLGFLLLFLSLLAAAPAGAQHVAQVQFVHNAPDPALASLDLYVNDERVLDDFAFRSATPYLEVPAGTDMNVVVAPAGSRSAGNTLAAFPMTFHEDRRYVVIVGGLLRPADFPANPTGRFTGLRIYVQEQARLRSAEGRQIQFFAVHGVPDAPMIDLVRGGDVVVAGRLAYGEVTGYLSLPPLVYLLGLRPAGGTLPLARYLTNLRTRYGEAFMLITSGFLSPPDDVPGRRMELLLVEPRGRVVRLPGYMVR